METPCIPRSIRASIVWPLPEPAMSTASINDAIALLNALLRGELSAIDSYDRAAAALADPPLPELLENRACHLRRSQVLARTIRTQGGIPDTASGVWGALAKAATRGAAVLGRAAVIAVLTDGEERGLTTYRTELRRGDADVRQLIGVDLLPAQKRSLARLRQLIEVEGPMPGAASGGSA
jgi:hypothetical protein